MITPIIILTLLIIPSLIALLLNRYSQTAVNVLNAGYLGLVNCFLFFALGHFVKTDGMIAMLPSWMPAPYWVVIASGILEIIVALGLLNKQFRRKAAWLAIAIFIGFLPVNFYAAFNHTGLGGHQWGPVYLFIRVPLQLILVGWSYLLIAEKGIFRKGIQQPNK